MAWQDMDMQETRDKRQDKTDRQRLGLLVAERQASERQREIEVVA